MRLLSTVVVPPNKTAAEILTPVNWTLRTGNVSQALQMWVGTFPKMWPPQGPDSLPGMLIELTEAEMNHYFRDGMASVVKTLYGSLPAQPDGSNLQCEDFVLMSLIANVLYGSKNAGLPWRPNSQELALVLRQSPQLQGACVSLLAQSDLGKLGIESWWFIPIEPDSVTWANTPACPSAYPTGWQAQADGDVPQPFFEGESPPLYLASLPGFQKPPQPSAYTPPGQTPPVTPVGQQEAKKPVWPWYVAIGGGLAAAFGLMMWVDSRAPEPEENPVGGRTSGWAEHRRRRTVKTFSRFWAEDMSLRCPGSWSQKQVYSRVREIALKQGASEQAAAQSGAWASDHRAVFRPVDDVDRT